MADGSTVAARGTAILSLSQGCYFVLGYLAVVLLAREFGPAAYGAYGVIMSVLVWLEETGRHAIPLAATKLVAESTGGSEELERCALILNVGLYALLFILLWGGAPWLASWFGIADGTLLFRIAAIDLPFFGAYTAYRAIHQGHRRFLQLACSQVVYALVKLVGVVLLIHFGLSVKNALLVNVAATIIGLACLLPALGLKWQGRWQNCRELIRPLLSSAAPMGVYYFVLLLRGGLVLWTFQIMSGVSGGAMIGVFVAAYNIARVPALVLTTVTTVVLPSISRALAVHDEPLAKRYINQALRFGFILYLPVCVVLMTQPEKLMQWIYSNDYSGGGVILALLVAGEGLLMIHAILGTVLIAVGQARTAAMVILASLIPSLGMIVALIHIGGGVGAALSNAVVILMSTVILGYLVWRRFGALMNTRSAYNIAFAGCVMFSVFALLSSFEVFLLLPGAVGVTVYFVTLLILRELGWRDFVAFIPGKSPAAV
jgi:O-antigen/teichoic acid export membrane protein